MHLFLRILAAFYAVIAPVDKNIVRRSEISRRGFQFPHIIFSQRQIRRKNAFSVLIRNAGGDQCICRTECLRRILYDPSSAARRLLDVDQNIFFRIQAVYRSGKQFPGFPVFLFHRDLQLLPLVFVIRRIDIKTYCLLFFCDLKRRLSRI